MEHILSAQQFDKASLLETLDQASKMDKILAKGGSDIARGKILGALFYEPSTRTRLSFETAMLRLGGNVISETDVHFSSITKGEVLPDTIRMVSGYADIIAMRSKNKGDAALAAEYSSVPVLNAGDGAGEHPTQGLLDLYTIYKEFPNKFDKEPLNVTFVGDLKYGRTVHSLCTLLRNFEGFKLNFIAPDALQLPEKYRESQDSFGEDLSSSVLQEADIIYDTRIQSERFESQAEYEKYKGVYVFDAGKVNQMKSSAILMHPLPRVNEITQEVDTLPQAAYFRQARNGVPVRMALIAQCLGLV